MTSDIQACLSHQGVCPRRKAQQVLSCRRDYSLHSTRFAKALQEDQLCTGETGYSWCFGNRSNKATESWSCSCNFDFIWAPFGGKSAKLKLSFCCNMMSWTELFVYLPQGARKSAFQKDFGDRRSNKQLWQHQTVKAALQCCYQTLRTIFAAWNWPLYFLMCYHMLWVALCPSHKVQPIRFCVSTWDL